MKRSPSAKKAGERRKKARARPNTSGRGASGRTAPVTTRGKALDGDSCHYCAKNLSGDRDRALFVEEEVGRIFCSESCITSYFTPEIERLEKEYFRRLNSSDLSGSERESLAHLRWITLQEPDEVWREKTLSGDYRYTLISQFQPGVKKVWSICICLFLRGEPSFLYLAFPTRNAGMVNHYRKGERVEWTREPKRDRSASAIQKQLLAEEDDEAPAAEGESGEAPAPDEPPTDRLADAWTEDETFLAQMTQERAEDDIPAEEFGLYQGCVEETLEEPDEVWAQRLGGTDTPRLFHFIRHYPDESPALWYVIVARETEDEEQIEILDAFPTRDSGLVERYRRGEQEVGQLDARPAPARVVH